MALRAWFKIAFVAKHTAPQVKCLQIIVCLRGTLEST